MNKKSIFICFFLTFSVYGKVFAQEIYIKPSASIGFESFVFNPDISAEDEELYRFFSKLYAIDIKILPKILKRKHFNFYPVLSTGYSIKDFYTISRYSPIQYYEKSIINSGLLGIEYSPGKKKVLSMFLETGISHNSFFTYEHELYEHFHLENHTVSTIINIKNSDNFGSIFRLGTNIHFKKGSLSTGMSWIKSKRQSYSFDNIVTYEFDTHSYTTHETSDNSALLKKDPRLTYFYYNLGVQIKIK